MAEQKTSESENVEAERRFDGSEPIFGTFMQTQVSLNSIRLTLDEQVVYSVFDLAADIETTRRVFLHNGEIVTALHELRRIENQFEMKVQSWEAEVSERDRNKRGKSGAEIAKMKAEVARVRAKINLTRRTITKLKIELHHISNHDPELEAKQAGPDLELPSPSEQLQELAHKSRVARVLHEFVGDGLPLNYFAAKRMIVGQLGARENAWDGKVGATLIAGWYPVIEKYKIFNAPSKKDQFHVRIWIVPKSPARLEEMVKDYQQFQMSIENASGLPIDLKWSVVEHRSELAPQSSSIQPFLDRIQNETFSPQNLNLKMLCATCREEFWKNASLKLCVRYLG